jgi:NAD(P)-dependent dehydrogenase (short-subunit alcohol dehydrogenase family)
VGQHLLLHPQAAEPELIKNKGVVVNVSSIVADSTAPLESLNPYPIAKASQVGHADNWLLVGFRCISSGLAAPCLQAQSV